MNGTDSDGETERTDSAGRADDSRTIRRRTALKLTGAAATAVAGCLGDDEEVDPDEWEDVDELAFGARTRYWEGVEPAHVEDEENPTIVLFEGETYDITWTNADGGFHNFEIRDDAGEVLASTDDSNEQGETLALSVEATGEMAQYACDPHQFQMSGDVRIE